MKTPIIGLDYETNCWDGLKATRPTSADAAEIAAARAEAQAKAREAAALRAEKAAATAAAAAATTPVPPPAVAPPAPQTVQELAIPSSVPSPVIMPAIAPPAPQTVQEMATPPVAWMTSPVIMPAVKPTATPFIMPAIAPKPVTKPHTTTVIVSTKPVATDPVTQFLNFIQNLFKNKSVPKYSKPGYKGGTISELERGR